MQRDEMRALWEQTVGTVADMNDVDLEETCKGAWAPMPVPRPALEQRIETVELIGSGGVGDVYRAHQQVLERDVALKQLKPALAGSAATRAGFLAEGVVNGRLEHPNIVPVYALGENPDTSLFLAMKLVEGQTWKTLLRGSKKGDLLFNLDILIQVCNAVAYAHSRSIVHNDLKPANVMLGPFGEVLVLDWGLAVDVRPVSDAASRVRHKSSITSPCGTPKYMAPELAMGQGHAVGPWTDVYLLGAILFEILTGAAPHQGKNLLDVVGSAISGASVRFTRPAPQELREICLAALQLRPEERPTVLELQQRLRQYLRHRESYKIAEGARQQLQTCLAAASSEDGPRTERTRLYEQFSEAVSGFRQARQLWSENPQAQLGEQEARHAFARTALQLGDLGLAEAQSAQLTDDSPASVELRAQVAEVGLKRTRELRARKQLRRALLAAIVCLIVGLSVGLYGLAVKNAAIAAEKQRVEEKSQTIAAQNLEIAAEKQQVEEQKLHADRRGEIAQEALDNLAVVVQQRLVRGLGHKQAVGVARDLLALALAGWEKMLEADVDRGVATLGRARAEINVGMLAYELDGSLERSGTSFDRALEQLESLDERDAAWWKLYIRAQRGLAANDFAAGRREQALARHTLCVEALRARLQDSPEDIALLNDLCDSLRRLTELHIDLGDVPAARASIEAALSRTRRALQLHPEDVELEYNLASSLGILCLVLYREGALNQSEVHLREALRLRRKLRKEVKYSVMLQGEVSSALSALGSLMLDLHRPEEGRAMLAENLQIRSELSALDPSHASRRDQLATAHRLLGEAEERLENHQSAAAHFAAGADLRRGLVALDSTSVRARRELAVDLSNQARMLHALGLLEQAQPLMLESLETMQELVVRVPESADLRRDLAVGTQAMGMLMASQGELSVACALLADAQDIFAGLLEQQPENYDLWRSQAMCATQMADLRAAQGAMRQALEQGAAGLAHWDRLLASGADNPRTLPEASRAYMQHAQRLLALQQIEAGLECFDQALQIMTGLLERQPGNRDAARQLAQALGELGEAHMIHGRFPEAARRAAASVAHWRALLSDEPGNLDDLFALANALRVSAQIGEVLGEDGRAEDQLREALELAEAVCAARPDEEHYRIQLSRIAFGLGLQCEKNGKLAEAVDALERAVASHAQLDGSSPDIRGQQEGLARERDRLLMVLQNGDLLDGSRAPETPAEHLLLASQRWQEGRSIESYESFAVALAAQEPEDRGIWGQAADSAAQASGQLEGDAALLAEQRALTWLGNWLDVLFEIRDEARQQLFRGGVPGAREQLEQVEGMLSYFRREHAALSNLRGKPEFEQLFERD